MHSDEFKKWMTVISEGRNCKNQIQIARDCKQLILDMDILSVIRFNITAFDDIREEVSKGSFFLEYPHYMQKRLILMF